MSNVFLCCRKTIISTYYVGTCASNGDGGITISKDRTTEDESFVHSLLINQWPIHISCYIPPTPQASVWNTLECCMNSCVSAM